MTAHAPNKELPVVMHALKKTALVIGLVVSALSTSGCEGPGPGRDAESDDIVAGKSASKLPEAVLVDMAGDVGRALCSGTLVAPRVVLTAGHCVHGWSSWHVTAPFAKGQSSDAESATTLDWDVDSEVVSPARHDVGLVFLATPITLASYPTIAKTHVPFGSKVENVGRIKDGQPSFSKLFVGREVTVVDGAKYGFPFAYASADVIESGDSGGPVVVPGTHEIVAVNSGAGNGLQVLARVDLVEAWVEQQIAAHGGKTSKPVAGCGALSFAGRCAGDVVEWCDGGAAKEVDCGARGQVCLYNKSHKYYDCM